MKKFVAVIGLSILVLSLGIVKVLNLGKSKALVLNDEKTSYGTIVSDIPPCTWDIEDPEPVMAENKTQAIVINLSSSKESECETLLTVRAPGFDTSPSKESQTVNLPADKKGSISWILSPRKTGVYDIAVTDDINTKIYGVTVNNIFGLSVIQAKIASFFGTLFGPMLTVPWWWDRLRKKKDNLESKAP